MSKSKMPGCVLCAERVKMAAAILRCNPEHLYRANPQGVDEVHRHMKHEERLDRLFTTYREAALLRDRELEA